MQWLPREDLDHEHADHLSKLVDEDDWCLNVDVYATYVLGGRQPRIDIFASEPRCLGISFQNIIAGDLKGWVDAFKYRWDVDERSGERNFACIYGRFGRMAEIIKKAMVEKVDCVIDI